MDVDLVTVAQTVTVCVRIVRIGLTTPICAGSANRVGYCPITVPILHAIVQTIPIRIRIEGIGGGLGIGIGLRTVHFGHILENWPELDWFEILSENFMCTGGRPMQVLDQDHYMFVESKPGTYELTEEKVGTRFGYVTIRTFIDVLDPADPTGKMLTPHPGEQEIIGVAKGLRGDGLSYHLIAEGLTNREIAARLVISLSTVKGHTANIYGKLGVHRRTLAVARARELGLLTDSPKMV